MNVTIYVPAELGAKLELLPKRSVSRICRDALAAAVAEVETERERTAQMLAVFPDPDECEEVKNGQTHGGKPGSLADNTA